MNDTLRRAGSVVLLVRYHDHGKVFRLPASLRRALRARIDRLNAVIDSIAVEHDVACLDLDRMPGCYEVSSWSVDRLHPSELGHRRLAAGFAELLAERGCVVPAPVSLRCSGGARPGPRALRRGHHAALAAHGRAADAGAGKPLSALANVSTAA